jgi:thiazole synthase
MSDPLIIAGREFGSRLFLGTAGYPNRKLMIDSIAASGTEMVTASIRRISLAGEDESLVDVIPKHVHFLPNTAGCQTAKDAVLTAELAREALETNWVKLEVIGDRELLYPDTEELVRATETLVDRLGARHLQSASDRADLRAFGGTGGARCRHRHRLRCCVGA